MLVWFVLPLLSLLTYTAEPARLTYSQDKEALLTTIIGQSLQQTISSVSVRTTERYFEFMESFRFSGESCCPLLRDFLRRKSTYRMPEEKFVIRFREPGLWDQYKWSVAVTISVILVQAALIAGLLVNRRRRRRAQDALGRLRAEQEKHVTDRTAQLETKTRALESFSYSVAHDLKAPLRGIDGYSRLLVEDYADRLDEEGRIILNSIRTSTERMNQLIDDLLTYSRLEHRTITFDSIELKSFAEAVVDEKRPELEKRKIALTMNINGETVVADADRLAHVLRNYLDNAIKFTNDSAEPRIEIGAEETEKCCRMWVRDNGIGFDMEYHDRVFGIFQRLHRAEDYPGTGVGLAIALNAIEMMGGRVWAESEPGRGSTFYLEVLK